MKKGVVYSIMAVLIALPALLFVGTYIGHDWGERFSIDAVVADQVHQLQSNLERDFARAAGIAGKRALLAMSERVIITGNPISDAKDAFRELVTNNTIDGEESAVMLGNSLTDWVTAVMEVKTGFDVSVDVGNASIVNMDGFNLLMQVDINISVSDRLNISRVDKHTEKNVSISIESLEDPLFPLKTQGILKKGITRYTFSRYTRKLQGTVSYGNCSGIVTFNPNATEKVSKILVEDSAAGIDFSGFAGVVLEENTDLGQPPYNVNCFVSGVGNQTSVVEENDAIFLDEPSQSAWLLPILEGISQGMYYRGEGPNFLQRLEGDDSPSTEGTGIETFLRPAEEVESKPEQSRLAYLYLSGDSHQACSKARWVNEGWFRLDAPDMLRYNLTDLSYLVC